MRRITPTTIIDRIFGFGQDRRGVDVTGKTRTAMYLLRLLGKRLRCHVSQSHRRRYHRSQYHPAQYHPMWAAPMWAGGVDVEAAAAWFRCWAGQAPEFASCRPVLVEVVSVRR